MLLAGGRAAGRGGGRRRWAGRRWSPWRCGWRPPGSGNRPVVVHLFDADYWVERRPQPVPVGAAAVRVVAGPGLWPPAVVVAGPGRGRSRRGHAGPGRATDRGDGHRRPRPPPARLRRRLPGRAGGRPGPARRHRPPRPALSRRPPRGGGRRPAPWLHRHLAGTGPSGGGRGGLALLALHGVQAGSWVADGLTDTSVGRRGLTAAAWDDSPVLAAVAALPPDVTVYSNAPEAVFLLTGRADVAPARPHRLPLRPPPARVRGRAGGDGRPPGPRQAVVVWLRPYAFRQRLLVPGRRARRGAGAGGRGGHPVPPASLTGAGRRIRPGCSNQRRLGRGRRPGAVGCRLRPWRSALSSSIDSHRSPPPGPRAPRCPGPPRRPATPPPGRTRPSRASTAPDQVPPVLDRSLATTRVTSDWP